MVEAGRLVVTVRHLDVHQQAPAEDLSAYFCISRVGDSFRHHSIRRSRDVGGDSPFTMLLPVTADQTELELHLHDAALLPGYARRPDGSSSSSSSGGTSPRRPTWLEKLDRYAALLSVGSPLEMSPELDGVGEMPLPDSVVAAMINQPSRVGSAFIDLRAAKELWVDEREVTLRTEEGEKCGSFEVRLLYLPILHEGPVKLKSSWMGWDKCHAELLGNGRLMLYSACDSKTSCPQEHTLRETWCMESAGRPLRCKLGREGQETGIDLTVSQSTGRPGKRKSKRVCLKFASEGEARTWEKHLQASHRVAKRPLPHLTEGAAELILESHRLSK